ncbi:hypothetical protein [Acetobacter pasteurianus]|uniref:Uncharacterized protein n=1 Tax=Acetobacter pasteurianus subsp. pasteurianus TaxID=481145 RepID=A0A1Y0Y7A6_ACEPA|nr:hypothetical protein [Acetobacter pasteurianus]ARW48314.1 hypothetical protein S1001342_02000 [Acetobacter pasteurianus subsp. pasteurianus]
MTEKTDTEDKTWEVRILDLSGGAEDNIVEDVGVFHDLAHANAFARAYVRDSVERCRTPGASAKDVLTTWFSFGEDAVVLDAGEDGWHSANELDDFTAHRATPMERDWRALDPRRLVEDNEDLTDLYGTTDDADNGGHQH